MTVRTRVNLTNALILALLGLVVVESTAIASQRTRKLETRGAGIVAANATAGGVAATPLRSREIVVVRKGAPSIAFTDDSAIAFQLSLTQAEIGRFESALAKDLARGDFRARQTRRVVSAKRYRVARSTAGELVLVRRELGRLKQALRDDLANRDFRGRHTRREVSGRDGAPSATGDDALADGAVSVSDDIWRLEMAVEKDLHARDFRATETHFAIDGRRWKVQ